MSRKSARIHPLLRATKTCILATIAVAVSIVSASDAFASTAATFRSASSAANNGASTSLVIVRPAGTIAGDVLIAQVMNRGSGAITPPSGWTSIRDTAYGSSHMQTFWHVMTADEPLSYSFTTSNAYGKTGGISAWSGVDKVTPIDVSTGRSGSGTSVSASGLTTSQDGAPVLFFGGHVGSLTYTAPTGLVERWDVKNSTGTYTSTAENADYVKATAGPTGDKVAIASSSGGGWVAQLLALRPAPASDSVPLPTSSPEPIPSSSSQGLWISPEEVLALPMSGVAWTNLKKVADGSLGTANVADQDNRHGTRVFGVALVYARTGTGAYREKARAAIMSAIGTESGARTLALGRNLASYVLAADLINLREMNPADEARFADWISRLRTQVFDTHGRWTSLNQTSDNSANNWGTFATASRIAIDLYLGDTTDLAKATQIHRAYGDRSQYPSGKPWGSYFQPTAELDLANWVCGTSSTWLAINPPCTKNGYDVGGAFSEDISRESANKTLLPQPSGSAGVSYSWEALQGVTFQAELLRRAGIPNLWDLNQQALKRATAFIQRAGWQETWSVTEYVPWLVNKRYGTSFPTRSGDYGRVVGFTDWTHAP